MHILLVEDNNTVRYAISEALRDFYTFDEAHTLDGALLRLGCRRFDCCILDLRLPDSTGEATFDAIRNASPNLPIVVYSGSYDNTDVKSLMSKGASACLTKASDGLVDLRLAVTRAVDWATGTSRAKRQLSDIIKIVPSLTLIHSNE